jgi:hypothetical protein
MAENITQFPKTLILKKRGIEIKRRDHGTAYNSSKASGKRILDTGKRSNRYGEFVAKKL